jgi:hypothetical protein
MECGMAAMALLTGAGVMHQFLRSQFPHELRLKATEQNKTIFRIGFITSVFCISKLASARGDPKLDPAMVPGRICTIY